MHVPSEAYSTLKYLLEAAAKAVLAAEELAAAAKKKRTTAQATTPTKLLSACIGVCE
jgi:hypothetical protein